MLLFVQESLGKPGGRPVVLLHGFLGSGKNLRSFALRWAEADAALRLLVPDLTGHGQSPPLPASAGLTDVAQDVLETARVQGFEGPLHWVGHSMGGRVALAALALPDACAQVTLLDVSAGPMPSSDTESAQVLQALKRAPPSTPTRTEMREFLVGDGGLSGPLADWLLMNTERDPSGGVRWRIDASRLRAFHDEAIREDFWPSVQKAGVPIHCIRGGKSSFVSDEDAARWERLGSRVSTVANAGHYLHVDAPELLLEILLSAS